MSGEYHYLSLIKLSRQIQQNKISSLGIVRQCLKRIEQINPTLNCFIEVTAESALKEAEAADAEIKNGIWKGLLHGVPIGIKDMFDTAGIRTTAAFEAFKDRVPQKNAEVVAKLKAAGAIIIGKMNMHQLAMGTTSVISYFGSVHNPWNTQYIAGGSSGGSAAALASGLCFATIDTDAIGSCRLPASCCGVTGFKPTYGLFSTKGILEGEKADPPIVALGHTAFMTRTVDDAAALLNILTSAENGPRKTIGTMKNPKVGVVQNFKATDEMRTNFLTAVEVFRSANCVTIEISVPFSSASFDLRNIERDRKTISESLFKSVDVLLLPTTTEPTPTIAEAEKREQSKAENDVAFSPQNTFFCNYYGLPAITVPCGFSNNGLPLGLQIVGPQSGEDRVLNIAGRFQNATSWHLRHPSIP